MRNESSWSLWGRWVLANATAEMVGLGATFAVGVGLFSGPSATPGVLPAILSGLAMAASGVVEGTVVGGAQWWAMRRSFSRIPARVWVIATVVGAFVAWLLGSIPATVASLTTSSQGETVQEPGLALMLILACGLGLVTGLVLALPQWRVLRRARERAWLWLPANSAAWAIGMPIIFAAIDRAQRSPTLARAVVTMAVALALTGAAVGGIHGVALVKLARSTARD